MNRKIYVPADFNGLYDSPDGPQGCNCDSHRFTVLDCKNMDSELAMQGATLYEGMHVLLYQPDVDDSGNDGLLVVDAVVHFDSDRQRWFAIIEENNFRHEGDPDRVWRSRK